MKTLWHFFISNIKYNKIELGISYSISFIVIILFNTFKKPINADGEILFSVAFYAMLYAFFSNKKKYNLKYLLSLPLSKSELIVTKVTSDFVYFLPAMSLAFIGILNTNLEFSYIPLFIILFQIICFVAFVMFDSDIEQPRLENAKSSFLNRLIYVRKGIDFTLFGVFVFYILFTAKMSTVDIWIKQYLIIITLAFVLVGKFHRTLKLMKDESLSYFKAKRDLFQVSWKVAIFAVPAVILHLSGYKMPSKYGKDTIYSQIEYGSEKKLEKFEKEVSSLSLDTISEKGYSPITAAIAAGKTSMVKILLNRGFKIDHESAIQVEESNGVFPIHLAVATGKKELIELVLNEKNLEQKTLKVLNSPLAIAANNCEPEAVDFLLKSGADINSVSANGVTPLMRAANNNCYASLAILLDAGADVLIKNKQGKLAIDYIKSEKYKYLIERKLQHNQKFQVREIAGSKKEIKIPKLKPPKILK